MINYLYSNVSFNSIDSNEDDNYVPLKIWYKVQPKSAKGETSVRSPHSCFIYTTSALQCYTVVCDNITKIRDKKLTLQRKFYWVLSLLDFLFILSCLFSNLFQSTQVLIYWINFEFLIMVDIWFLFQICCMY